jgi:hypothetical protein
MEPAPPVRPIPRLLMASALFGGASGNVIGGPTLASRNVISGNSQGIQILGAGTVLNRIEGNIIGLNAAANAAIPNRRNGILIADAKRHSHWWGRSHSRIAAGKHHFRKQLQRDRESHGRKPHRG